MKITKLPNKILRQRSLEVSLPLSKEDQKIADNMIKYIVKSQEKDSKLREGIGIAAVQMGHLKRMFYVNMPVQGQENFEEFLINPKITATSKQFAALEVGEGCLSIDSSTKGQAGLVHRKNKIAIQGYSYLTKQEVEINLEGVLAIVFQHEMDHLDGKLFIDRIDHKEPFEPKEDEVIIG